MEQISADIKVNVYEDNPDGYHAFQSFFLHGPLKQVPLLYNKIFETANLQAGQKVIEVGIGTGLNLSYYPDDIELYGIDLSPSMVETSKRQLAEMNRKGEIHQGNAKDIQYPEGTFDVVVCIFVLCTIDDNKKALSELFRICKPGGKIVLFDYHKANNETILFDQQFMRETMSNGIIFQGKPVIVCDPLYDLDNAKKDLPHNVLFDEHLERSFSASFRATVLEKPS